MGVDYPYGRRVGESEMAKTSRQYKELSIKEFTRAASKYESDSIGVYKLCRRDYAGILEEIEKEDFQTLLDAGCGTAPILSLLSEKYPDRLYTGIDLTPMMIEAARAKHLPNAEFVIGDCEDLPFANNSFNVIICSQSMHHYPNPQAFFNGAFRCLKAGGRLMLILREFTSDNRLIQWFIAHVEMPLLNLAGYGDVKMYTPNEVKEMCRLAGFSVGKLEKRKRMRLHCVARKPG